MCEEAVLYRAQIRVHCHGHHIWRQTCHLAAPTGRDGQRERAALSLEGSPIGGTSPSRHKRAAGNHGRHSCLDVGKGISDEDCAAWPDLCTQFIVTGAALIGHYTVSATKSSRRVGVETDRHT